MKRKSGGGRPKSTLPGGPSSQKYKCPVPGCNVVRRSDKLRNHYRDRIKFGKDNKPVPSSSSEFRKLSKTDKVHTQYFLDNGFHSTKYPPNRTLANAASNPFALADKQVKEKKSRLAAACEEVHPEVTEGTTVSNPEDTDDSIETGDEDEDDDGVSDVNDENDETRVLHLDDIDVSGSMDLSLSDVDGQSDLEGSENSEVVEEQREASSSSAAFPNNSDTSSKTYLLSEKEINAVAEKLASILVEKKQSKNTEEEKEFNQLVNGLKEGG